MGEIVIAVWRNRAEPRNGFRSTIEQGSLELVFLPFWANHGMDRKTLVLLLLLEFHFKKPQPQTDGVNQRCLHNRAPTKADWMYAGWANLLGIQTTPNKWSIAVSIGPVED